MSSRILDSATTFEPLRWKARSPAHGGDARAQEIEACPGDSQAAADAKADAIDQHHNALDEARIRELDSTVKLLERRLQDDTRSAREQGRQSGLADGIQAGMQQEAAKWTDALARLTRSIEAMSKVKERLQAEIEQDAVKLALAISRKILNRELSSDPEALVGLARVALEKLNLRELQRVRVHPADAPAIEKLLSAASAPKRLEVVADGTLERGGAIFETERGMLDASVTTQLSEIERGLADILRGA